MAWFNADDKMHSHPKPRKAGLEAMGLWVLCGTFCTDNLTDGYVPDWYIRTWPRGLKLAQKLVNARFWDEAEDGYQFLSWEEYQRTKAQVEDARKSWRDRQRRSREKKENNDRDQTA